MDDNQVEAERTLEEEMATAKSRLQTFLEYREMTDMDEIGRRKFVNNAFDGVLTMVGVVMGSYVAGVTDPAVVISTGVTTSMAIGVSGFWGAFISEKAERKRELDDLGKALLSDLSETKQARAGHVASWVVSAVDGLSPFLAAFFVVLPFLFTALVGNIDYIYYASISFALIFLFGLGVFTGSVGRDNIIGSGLKMVVAGVVCIALSFLLNVS